MKACKLLFFSFLILLFYPAVSFAVDRYVSPSGEGDFCTKTNPCSLQTGLEESEIGENTLLYPGTYSLNSPLNLTLEDLDLALPKSVQRPVIEGDQETYAVSALLSSVSNIEIRNTYPLADSALRVEDGAVVLNTIVRSDGRLGCLVESSSRLENSFCQGRTEAGLKVTEGDNVEISQVTTYSGNGYGLIADARNDEELNLYIGNSIFNSQLGNDVLLREGPLAFNTVEFYDTNMDEPQIDGQVSFLEENPQREEPSLQADHLHQQLASVTIDSAGDNPLEEDIEKDQRIVADIGADEYDTILPEVEILSGPEDNSVTNDSTPTFTFEANERATFECRLESASDQFSSCQNSYQVNEYLQSRSDSFEVRATDINGNLGSTTTINYSYEDVAPPQLSFLETPGTSNAPGSQAQFRFATNDENASLQCRLYEVETTTPAYSDCSSGQRGIAALLEGDYIFEIRSTDLSGNSSEDEYTFAIDDNLSPQVSIDEYSDVIEQGEEAVFTFSVDDTNASSECRVYQVDTLAPDYQTCDNSFNANNLEAGNYRFEAVATDRRGNQGNANVSFSVEDTTKPQIVFTKVPPAFVDFGTTLEYEYQASDPNSDFVETLCSFREEGEVNNPVPCQNQDSLTYAPAPGNYIFYIHAEDEAGNFIEVERRVEIEQEVPDLILNGPQNNENVEVNSVLTYSFSSSDPEAELQCVYGKVGQTQQVESCGTNGYGEKTITLPDNKGAYTFSVFSTDDDGDFYQKTAEINVVDSTPPTLDVNFSGDTSENSLVTAFIETDDKYALLECRLFKVGSLVDYEDCGGVNGVAQYSKQVGEKGMYRLQVKATDVEGRVTDYDQSFQVRDTKKPQTRITQKPKKVLVSKKAKTVVFKFKANEAATFECKLNSGAWRKCANKITYKLKPKKYTFQVRAKDDSGNLDSSPAKHKFQIKKPKKRR